MNSKWLVMAGLRNWTPALQLSIRSWQFFTELKRPTEGKFWFVPLFLLYYTGGESAQKWCTITDHELRWQNKCGVLILLKVLPGPRPVWARVQLRYCEQLLYTTLTCITKKRIERYSGSCRLWRCSYSEAIDKVVGSLHCNHFNDRRQ